MANQRTGTFGMDSAASDRARGTNGLCVTIERWSSSVVRWSTSGSHSPMTAASSSSSVATTYLIDSLFEGGQKLFPL